MLCSELSYNQSSLPKFPQWTQNEMAFTKQQQQQQIIVEVTGLADAVH